MTCNFCGYIILLVPYDYRQTSDMIHTLVCNNFWALRCSWSIICRCCSNYIFILKLTPGFKGLGKNNCKTRWETSLGIWCTHIRGLTVDAPISRYSTRPTPVCMGVPSINVLHVIRDLYTACMGPLCERYGILKGIYKVWHTKLIKYCMVQCSPDPVPLQAGDNL